MPRKIKKINVSLIKYLEEEKKKHRTLIEIFNSFALKNKKSVFSIRNEYYKTIKYLRENNTICEQLGINILLHNIQKFNHFTKDTAKQLINKINSIMDEGLSVRGACMQLANGDIKETVRLQNKYYEYTKSLKECDMKNNVIKFKPKKEIISEQDINNLFMGLVKLIKRTAMEQANKNLISECEFANDTLRKTIIKLNDTEKNVKNLSLDKTVLSNKVAQLQEKLSELRLKYSEITKN